VPQCSYGPETANIYNTDIHSNATCIYVQRSTTLLSQKNKRNFGTIASRVSASPRRRHCRCRIPGQQERKVRRRIRHFSGDHHRTAAVITTARLLLLPSQQPRRYYRWNGHDTTGRSPPSSTSSKRRSTPFPEPRNAFHMRYDAVSIGNITLTRMNVFATFICPSHEKKTCAQIDNFTLTDYSQTARRRHRPSAQTAKVTSRYSLARTHDQWSVTRPRQTLFTHDLVLWN